jgi:ATP-dependent Clp protease ATP-binding subunit ClpA
LLSCNLGAAADAHKQIGFATVRGQGPKDPEEVLRQTLSTYFKSEFLARIDRVVLFRELEMPDFDGLLERQLEGLRRQMQGDRSITIELTPEARAYLLESCADQEEGARGFVRRFERLLSIPLREAAGREGCSVIRVTVKGHSSRFGDCKGPALCSGLSGQGEPLPSHDR